MQTFVHETCFLRRPVPVQDTSYIEINSSNGFCINLAGPGSPKGAYLALEISQLPKNTARDKWAVF
jgi:hypothetical protein